MNDLCIIQITPSPPKILTRYELKSTAVLVKMVNFAVVPDTVPVEEIVVNIKSGIRNSRILNKAKPPKSNLSAKEKKVIKSLKPTRVMPQ